MEIWEVTLRAPGPFDVITRNTAAGICHSQLHQIFAANRQGPMVLGHEAVGVVVEVGSSVTHLSERDQVLLTWMPRSTGPTARRPTASWLDLGDGSIARNPNTFAWSDYCVICGNHGPSTGADLIAGFLGGGIDDAVARTVRR